MSENETNEVTAEAAETVEAVGTQEEPRKPETADNKQELAGNEPENKPERDKGRMAFGAGLVLAGILVWLSGCASVEPGRNVRGESAVDAVERLRAAYGPNWNQWESRDREYILSLIRQERQEP